MISYSSPHSYNQIAWYQAPFSYDRPYLSSFTWPRLTPLQQYTCQLCSGEGVKKQSQAKSFLHSHNDHLINGILNFQDGLVETFNVVFQALPILLVDYEKVGGILLLDPTAHEIGDKEFAQVTK